MGSCPMRVWVEAMRPKTLPAGAVPVFLAWAHAAHDGVFNFAPALICLLFALLIQIGTNFANDYYDGVRGTDGPDRLGPRRAVASGLVSAGAMGRASALMLGVALAVGLLLMLYGGWGMVVLGLVCAGLAVAYTGGPYPLAYWGLGDVFVVVFFGLVPVAFTYYVQAGVFSGATWWTGLGCGLLATNLLVVNNYRDVEGDARAGKRTLVVRFGRNFARWHYALNVLGALMMPLALLAYGYTLGVALPAVVLGWPSWRLSKAFARSEPSECNRLLALSGALLMAYGVLLAIGLAFVLHLNRL